MRLPRFYQFFFSRFHSFHYALSARACLVVFLTAQGNPINYKLTMYDRHRRKVDYGEKKFRMEFQFWHISNNMVHTLISICLEARESNVFSKKKASQYHRTKNDERKT